MEDGIIFMIDQILIPHEFKIIELHDVNEVYRSIKNMNTRGAPSIGATAAYGVAQAVIKHNFATIHNLGAYLDLVCAKIESSRPTARDLFHAVDYMDKGLRLAKSVEEAKKLAVKLSNNYADISVDACKKIGEFGNKILIDGAKVLTHCNAGALATVDFGTALAPVRIAHEKGKDIFVFVDETRPRSQGSRITAFELKEEGIPYSIIADNAAGHFMLNGEINVVIVGTDRVARNGDVVNKIGTYEKAVVAYENNIPFYVTAPLSTIDIDTRTGQDIKIEERDQEEVLYSYGLLDNGNFGRVRVSPEGGIARNPAFDVTPAKYITGLITEKGIIKPTEKEILRIKS